jgi:hypothetical protein
MMANRTILRMPAWARPLRCATLAACGVDGEPETPTRAAHALRGRSSWSTRTDPARVSEFFPTAPIPG